MQQIAGRWRKMKKKGNEGTLRRQRLRDVYCEHEIDRMKCSDQIGGKTCRQILLVLTTLREPRFSTNCERRELANQWLAFEINEYQLAGTGEDPTVTLKAAFMRDRSSVPGLRMTGIC
jgi:hypothetical protein